MICICLDFLLIFKLASDVIQGFPIDLVWSPIDGPLIKLWKANPDGSPKLPNVVPSPILYAQFGAMMHQG
jgi:hypothetical protein